MAANNLTATSLRVIVTSIKFSPLHGSGVFVASLVQAVSAANAITGPSQFKVSIFIDVRGYIFSSERLVQIALFSDLFKVETNNNPLAEFIRFVRKIWVNPMTKPTWETSLT